MTVIHPATAAQAINDGDSNIRQKFFKALVNPRDYLKIDNKNKNKTHQKTNLSQPGLGQGQGKPDVCILADKAANCTLAGRPSPFATPSTLTLSSLTHSNTLYDTSFHPFSLLPANLLQQTPPTIGLIIFV